MKLVVYGTLKDMPGFELIGPTTIQGQLYSLGPFPGAINIGDGDSTFKAYVYEVPDSMWDQLDQYEGVSSGLYRRGLVDTEYGQSFIYIFNKELPEGAPQIQEWR